MKKLIVVVVVAVLMNNGCASYLGVKYCQSERQTQAIRFAAENGKALATVDLMAIGPEYFKAWGQHPWFMAGATIVDSASTLLVGREIKDALQGDDTAESSGTQPLSGSTYNIGGDFNYVGRDGSVNSTRDMSTTGAE